MNATGRNGRRAMRQKAGKGRVMANVIERHGHTIDDRGFIHYDDRPITYAEAEKVAGFRLDRRCNYAIIDGEVCELARWSQACSGCYEGHNIEHSKGSGCHECGYTGRTREGHWVPIRATKEAA
jgi:hypothetical protein